MTDLPAPFGAQLIGQTEKTLNAILDRQLAGAVSEPEWVTLVLTAGSGGPAGHGQLIARAAGVLKTGQETAAAHIGQLAAKGLVQMTPGPGARVTLTPAGRQLLDRVRMRAGEITQRLWGDLPAADLEIAGRVLNTVRERAEAELAAGYCSPPPR